LGEAAERGLHRRPVEIAAINHGKAQSLELFGYIVGIISAVAKLRHRTVAAIADHEGDALFDALAWANRPTASTKPMTRPRSDKFINIIPAAYRKRCLVSTRSASMGAATDLFVTAFAAKHENHDRAIQRLPGDDGLRRQLVRIGAHVSVTQEYFMYRFTRACLIVLAMTTLDARIEAGAQQLAPAKTPSAPNAKVFFVDLKDGATIPPSSRSVSGLRTWRSLRPAS